MAINIPKKQKIQEAQDTPFNNTTNGFVGENVQEATQDIRDRHLSSVNSITTVLNATTTAVFSSFTTYVFSGTATGHKLDLPNATTCTVGHKFEVWNLSSENIDVRDNGSNTLLTLKQNGRTEIILRDNSTANGIWVSTYTLDNGNVFGTQLYYQEEEEETSNNSLTYVNKVTLVTPSLPLGDYLTQFQFTWRSSTANRVNDYRIQRNSVNIDAGEAFIPNVAERMLVSGFRRISNISGVQTYTLDFRRGSSTTTVFMYGARLFVWRVG
jgi:hypothetical protein